MEVITVLTTVVLFVFGILQIILFFKIWRMTNDVKKIANEGDLWQVRKAILIGDKEEIRKAILNRMANVIIASAKSGYLMNAENIINNYKDSLDKYGISISDAMKEIKNAQDVINLF